VVNETIYWRGFVIFGLVFGAILARKVSYQISEYKGLPVQNTESLKDKVVNAVVDFVKFRSTGRGFLVGFALSLGAMIGGGCTSGAFLAAWPTLSIGSFCMGGTFFVVSMATAALMRVPVADS